MADPVTMAVMAGTMVAGKMMTKKPKAPDTSGLKRQEEQLSQQENRLKQQEADALSQEETRKKREAASNRAKKGRTGGASLLSGLETGITPVSEKRKTLG